MGPVEREQVAQALRAGAGDLSVSLLEVRPGDIRRLLRNRSVDIVLARTIAATEGIDSASRRPTTAVLWVPITHPLAAAASVRLAQLDGARMLTWNLPGTPFTDLILDRLAAAGCTVETVQARVTGAAYAAELSGLGAVALMPAGWPPGEGVAGIPLEDDVALPLLMLWRAGIPTPAAERVRAGMASSAPHP
ncbi:MAG: LysR substrate-binding domain-containing protein [Pseudonocardiaceae bacterium]